VVLLKVFTGGDGRTSAACTENSVVFFEGAMLDSASHNRRLLCLFFGLASVAVETAANRSVNNCSVLCPV